MDVKFITVTRWQRIFQRQSNVQGPELQRVQSVGELLADVVEVRLHTEAPSEALL